MLPILIRHRVGVVNVVTLWVGLTVSVTMACCFAESSVEFGTVLVFTCRGSCWSDSDVWREESVLLQHDPDQHRFR